MDIQSGTHAGPCDLVSIIGKFSGNGQHGVWLGPGSTCGQCDDRRVAGTAQDNVPDEF